MSKELTVCLPSKDSYSYPILLAKNNLIDLSNLIKQLGTFTKIIVISDEIVAALYADKVLELLNANFATYLITFPAGEINKSAENKAKIEEQMFSIKCDRNTLCIALGGGVVGDLVGFTAATYMRGIQVLQVPTSLLSMIDSSVGGKTAINTSYGKNIIGAFWQPSAVLMDVNFLHSLPQDQLINGFIEALKIFLTFDKQYVEFCFDNIEKLLTLNEEFLLNVIHKAVSLKAHVVEVDEKEQNLRMSLNFGHTVGHALEKLTKFEVLHGFAVGYGILAEARVSQLLGLINEQEYQYIARLMVKIGVKPNYFKQFENSLIIEAMRGDKKNTNQTIKIVLINGIGSMKNIDNQVAFPVTENIINQAFDCLKEDE